MIWKLKEFKIDFNIFVAILVSSDPFKNFIESYNVQYFHLKLNLRGMEYTMSVHWLEFLFLFYMKWNDEMITKSQMRSLYLQEINVQFRFLKKNSSNCGTKIKTLLNRLTEMSFLSMDGESILYIVIVLNTIWGSIKIFCWTKIYNIYQCYARVL